jgi:hypothetical protein
MSGNNINLTIKHRELPLIGALGRSARSAIYTLRHK